MANERVMSGDLIRHHVTNAPISEDSIFYPIFKFFTDITIPYTNVTFSIPFNKHVLMLWIAAFVIILISLWATKSYSHSIKIPLLWRIPRIGEKFFIYETNVQRTIRIPLLCKIPKIGKRFFTYKTNVQKSKLATIYEMLLEFIKQDIVFPNIGDKHAKRWTPLVASFFIFILICNFIGLIPFFEKLGGGGGLATITFIAIIIAGTLKHGLIGHFKNLIPSGVPAPVLIILIPIEIVGMFVKPIALTLRLGANMTAGHIGMLAIFGLPYLIGSPGNLSSGELPSPNWGFAIIAVGLNTGIFFLEMIVALVQAYVFTLLSTVFIGMAIHADH